MNKYLGTVEITLGDKDYTLHYDYVAISEVISKFGKEILNKLYECTPTEVAEIAVIGLRKDSISLESFLEISPPIFPMCKAIDMALGFSYFGPDGPPKVSKEDSKKKSQ